jgi:hypothetical protein
MKLLSVFLLLLCMEKTYAQTNILVFKEKNRNVKSWVHDNFIHFQYITTQWMDGKIKKITSDSIYINTFALRQIPNQFGFTTIDTSWFGLMGIHVSEIIGMPGNRYRSGIIGNGTLFQIGGSSYILVNILNSIIKSDNIFRSANITSIGIAAGIILIGKLQSLKYRPYIRIRKKYSMQIISTQAVK